MRIIAFENGGFLKKVFIWRPQNVSIQRVKVNEAFKATPGSEYFSIAQRIERVIFDFGENLSLKHEQFYEEEYSTLKEYLENEEYLSAEDVELILNAQKEKEELWKVNVSICEGYRFADLFNEYIWGEDYLIPRLNKILED